MFHWLNFRGRFDMPLPESVKSINSIVAIQDLLAWEACGWQLPIFRSLQRIVVELFPNSLCAFARAPTALLYCRYSISLLPMVMTASPFSLPDADHAINHRPQTPRILVLNANNSGITSASRAHGPKFR